MIVHDMEQYSPEWWEARRGVPTASSASRILTSTGKLSAQSKSYLNELVADRLGLGDPPTEPTEWMLRGHELEPEARALFTFQTGIEVNQVGFVTNDDGTAGCSPDGLINDAVGSPSAGWECKCPKPSTMVGYLVAGSVPSAYLPQLHMSMVITGLRNWIFMAYHPEMDSLIVHETWNEYTDKLETALVDFLHDLKVVAKRFGVDNDY